MGKEILPLQWAVHAFQDRIFTEESRAEQIAGVIMDAAHTGSVGEGLVAVLPVHKVFRIRSKALAKSGEV